MDTFKHLDGLAPGKDKREMIDRSTVIDEGRCSR